jgi:hypothetical protein
MSERDHLIWKAERAARVLGPDRALRIANEAIEPESPYFDWSDVPTRDLRIAIPSLTEEARATRRQGHAGGMQGVEEIPSWFAAGAAVVAALTVFALVRTAKA